MTTKINAARRLCDALTTDLDFALYLDAHPNESRAYERLMADLTPNQEHHNGKEASAERDTSTESV
jgi:hypothetical protein